MGTAGFKGPVEQVLLLVLCGCNEPLLTNISRGRIYSTALLHTEGDSAVDTRGTGVALECGALAITHKDSRWSIHFPGICPTKYISSEQMCPTSSTYVHKSEKKITWG